METSDVVRQPAVHRRADVATQRPDYRTTKKRETAVKVYTINQESRFLIVQKVPALGCMKELINCFSLYGPIEEYRILDDYPDAEEFYDVYWIKFQNPADARVAKNKCNNLYFLGSELHVTYAPEYETLEDTRVKFEERRRIILGKLRQQQRPKERTPHIQPVPTVPASMLPFPAPDLSQYPPTPYELANMHAMQQRPEDSRKRKSTEGEAPPWETSANQNKPPHPQPKPSSVTSSKKQVPQDPMALGLNPSVNKTILNIRSKLSGLSAPTSKPSRVSIQFPSEPPPSVHTPSTHSAPVPIATTTTTQTTQTTQTTHTMPHTSNVVTTKKPEVKRRRI